VPADVNPLQIDLLSLSAHKIYGPKGVGALYVRRSAPRFALTAQMDGGGHESGMRSGTLNVPAIVGFGEACAICGREMAEEGARLAAWRDRLAERLIRALDGVTVNGSREHRLPNNLNVSIAGVDAESLLMSMPEIAMSTGSACSSTTQQPSHVLRAIGLNEDMALASIRIGLGRFNTEEEVDHAGLRIVESVKKLRALSPATFL